MHSPGSFFAGATTANNSLGKNRASYFDVGYVPTFLDQENLVFDNATLGKLARAVCGDNKQCLFDIHTTGKVSIGKATKQAVESFVAVIDETETPGKLSLLITKALRKKPLVSLRYLRISSEQGVGPIYRYTTPLAAVI